jgi:hypothetical protein
MDCSIFFGDNGSLGGISTIKEINPQKKSLLAICFAAKLGNAVLPSSLRDPAHGHSKGESESKQYPPNKIAKYYPTGF